MIYHKLSHAIPRVVLLLFICAASIAPAQQTAVARQGYTVVQLQRGQQNHLLISLEINGKPAIFMVDSGAPITAISRHLAESLHLSPPPSEAGVPSAVDLNGSSRKVVWAQSLKSGAMDFGAGPLAIGYSDNSEINSKYLRGDVEGIMGADVLRRYKALLNCGTAQIFFKRDDTKSPAIEAGLQKAGYKGIPMKESEGHFYIEATLGEKTGLLMVDTGSFVTFLRKNILKSLGIGYQYTGMKAENFRGDLSGVLQVDASEHRLRIATIPILREIAAVDGHLETEPKSVFGTLGAELLAFHRAIIDFDRKIFYFHPEFSGKK